jgi:hypothetical protein
MVVSLKPENSARMLCATTSVSSQWIGLFSNRAGAITSLESSLSWLSWYLKGFNESRFWAGIWLRGLPAKLSKIRLVCGPLRPVYTGDFCCDFRAISFFWWMWRSWWVINVPGYEISQQRH